MSFTYTPDLANPLYYVRWKIGDTQEEAPIFHDEEINYFLSKIPNPTEQSLNKLALQLLRQILGQILRGPSRERSGGYEVYGATAEALKLAISQLEKEVRSASTPKPSFGGVYQDETQGNRENPAYVPTKFYNGRIAEDGDESFPQVRTGPIWPY